MSSNIDEDAEVKIKKRRNEVEWKRNKIKRLKAEGKQHVNWKGNIIPARSTGETCRLVLLSHLFCSR